MKLRESWATHTNQALEQAGNAERIDHRTLEEQNINRIPQIHLGANVAAMMQRGIVTERGEEYERIQVANQQIEANQKQLAIVEKAIETEGVAIQTAVENKPSMQRTDPNADISHLELTLSETLTNQVTSGQGDNYPPVQSPEANRGNYGNFESEHLVSHQDDSPQRQPTLKHQGTGIFEVIFSNKHFVGDCGKIKT